ncbi:transcription repressor NadR [Clostridium aminobutyricum]|uniref:Transcription repressor NadR n=1 Tax=Clostridium aminobutyricum TaxID=33953 RepID=A0A939D9M5_CLOAM|nr:transcription repressor NadR [Clostridium aminobutyricum]MBN7773645.1 transcription repressor NadR [Clostridium aminobutyricum]
MNALERRNLIVNELKNASSPISASSLASQLNVSRQIIVSDVALLRASGIDISATPRGYILADQEIPSDYGFIGFLACKHTAQQLKEELYTIVDFGAEVLDVTIEHSLYGQLSGRLDLGSRYEVDLFLKKVQNGPDLPLSILTEGIHLHKIGCKDEKTFELIKQTLTEKGMLLI